MNSTLVVPLWFIALGAAHFFGPHWLFIALSAIGTAHLSAMLSYLSGPTEHSVALTTHGYTVEELYAALSDAPGDPDHWPVCLGGVGVGILPVTDWFTARIGGKTVVVLEHIEGGQ